MIYCIDTSALMDGWTRHYPPDTFGSLWKKVEDTVASSALISTQEVLIELSKKDDDLYAWAKARQDAFLQIEEPVQSEVKSILQAFPRLVDMRRNRSQADPFVIAQARISSAVVVTEERPSTKPGVTKIPDVCDSLNIECIDFLAFIRRNGWRF